MFEDPSRQRRAAKWIVGTFTVCILIYLGVRHIQNVTDMIMQLFHLVKPLWIGCILALILNVPMSAIEHRLFAHTATPWKQRFRRPLAIVLSLVLVLGIFIGVAFLVLPELFEAVKLVTQIATSAIDSLSRLEENTDLSQLPLGEYLSRIEVNWAGLKLQFENWFAARGGSVVNQAVNAMGFFVGSLVNFFVGLVFSIYILANKELLKRQICRLVRVWLPRKFGGVLIHICSVCNTTFRDFVAGQATEAVILGSLCMLGMVILAIPYAPMIGALVGVTALIPIVGAFVGTIVGAVMILTVNPLKAVIFVLFLLILQQIEGNLIYPRVVGAKIKLPAMWVLAAVTIGGNLGGPLGMLLGVPAASAAYSLLREATELRENACARESV